MTSDKPATKSGGFLKTLLLFAVFAWLLRSLVIAAFSIPSGSMLPRLFVGDYLFVAKWPYGYSRASFLFGFPPMKGRILSDLPERGDVVVFQGPSRSDVIKRVIGLPGDTIATRGGQLVLNGKLVPKVQVRDFAIPVSPNTPCRVVPPASQRIVPTPDGPACVYAVFRETLPNGRTYSVIDQVENPIVDDFGPITVPQGTVFMMGDNRDDSADSRIPPALGGMGFVPVEALVGRALITFWSTDGSAEWFKPWTWFTALRPERIGMTFG